jgi:hypothetical protein
MRESIRRLRGSHRTECCQDGMAARAIPRRDRAHTVENPEAFTSKRAVFALPLEHQRILSRPEDLGIERPLVANVLDEVTIVGVAHRRSVATEAKGEPCQATWQTLASGPATRRVRTLCLTADENRGVKAL